jgi:hypothetical protein
MAYTVTKIYSDYTSKGISVYDVTADAASGVVTTGFNAVDSVIGMVPVSMGTAAIKIKKNLSAASAAANGSIMVSSAVNGDNFILIVAGH